MKPRKSLFLKYAQNRASAIDKLKAVEFKPTEVGLFWADGTTWNLIQEAKNGSYDQHRSNDAYIQSQSSSREGT